MLCSEKTLSEMIYKLVQILETALHFPRLTLFRGGRHSTERREKMQSPKNFKNLRAKKASKDAKEVCSLHKNKNVKVPL